MAYTMNILPDKTYDEDLRAKKLEEMNIGDFKFHKFGGKIEAMGMV